MKATDVFNMDDVVNQAFAELDAKDPALLAQKVSSDSKEGPQAVADLLTFLPPEKRMGALIGFVMAMLCD